MNTIRIGHQDALPDLEYCYDGLIEHVLDELDAPGIVTVPLMRAHIWTESRMNPLAISPTGPAGLAQFALLTWNDGIRRDWTEMMGIPRQRFDIFKSVWRMGEHFLALVAWFSRSGCRGEDILKLALAAYNQGQGSIMRGQAMASDMGGDRHSWDSVAAVIDRVLPEGRAEEVRQYVSHILQRRDYYMSASITGAQLPEVRA
jgi:membrane-bound lytic murein transglycosylase MltF